MAYAEPETLTRIDTDYRQQPEPATVKQRRQPGYVQALEGYELYTFVMGHSLSEYSEDISRIKKFSHHLQLRYLVKEEGVWYACREAQYLPEELSASA